MEPNEFGILTALSEKHLPTVDKLLKSVQKNPPKKRKTKPKKPTKKKDKAFIDRYMEFSPNGKLTVIWDLIAKKGIRQTWMIKVMNNFTGKLQCKFEFIADAPSALSKSTSALSNPQPSIWVSWNPSGTLLMITSQRRWIFASIAKSKVIENKSHRFCEFEMPPRDQISWVWSGTSLIYRRWHRNPDAAGVFEMKVEFRMREDAKSNRTLECGIHKCIKRRIHSSKVKDAIFASPNSTRFIIVPSNKTNLLIDVHSSIVLGRFIRKFPQPRFDGQFYFSESGRRIGWFHRDVGGAHLTLYDISDIDPRQQNLVSMGKVWIGWENQMGQISLNFWTDDIIVFCKPIDMHPNEYLIGFYSFERDCCLDGWLNVPSAVSPYYSVNTQYPNQLVISGFKNILRVWLGKLLDYREFTLLMENWLRTLTIELFVWDLVDLIYDRFY